MHLNIIASGSNGNLAVLGNKNDTQSDDWVIFIDAGLTNIQKKIQDIVDGEKIAGVFYTHRHKDHMNTAAMKYFASQEIPQIIPFSHTLSQGENCYDTGKSFMEDDCFIAAEDDILTIEMFDCMHDVPCVGYAFELKDGKYFTWIPDTAQITDKMEGYIMDSSYVGLDCNYDTEMISTRCWPENMRLESAGKPIEGAEQYSEELIGRIKSHGHLSTQQVIEIMRKEKGVKHWFLTHLSNTFNHPKVVVNRMETEENQKEVPFDLYDVCHHRKWWKPINHVFE